MTDRHPLGVIAAVPTPVTGDLEPDPARFLVHARWALAHGCDGLNVLGTTGEATSFSVAQRKVVMDAAAGALDTGALMVGTATADLASTVDLTRHAHALGFSAALILPTFYYKGATEAGLRDWFAAIVERTADTPIPIYLYNFPQMTGLTLTPALAHGLAQSFPDRVFGAKDSSGDLAHTAALAARDGFRVFPSDEAALAIPPDQGFVGCISATVNIVPMLAAALWNDRGNPDRAQEVRQARASIGAYPLVPAVKFLAGRLHGDSAFERTMPPHQPLNAEQRAALSELSLPTEV